MAAALTWLFGGRDQAAENDGTASIPEPSTPIGEETPSDGGRATVAGRRDRAVDDGPRQLRDAIAQKVLHGWLQNRHQTLYPLTVNLRALSGPQRAALADWMAVALLAGQVPEDVSVQEARTWLAGAGADAVTLAAFSAAVTHPPALSESIASLMQHGVGPYAYVMALIALDPADPATLPFLDYVAVRLSLPTTVVRSAIRRYRR